MASLWDPFCLFDFDQVRFTSSDIYLNKTPKKDVMVTTNTWEGQNRSLQCNVTDPFLPGYKPHTTEEYAELTEKIRDEMAERDVVGWRCQRWPTVV